jgi:hypothetical protein
MPGMGGKCPVCDAGIELDPANQVVVDIANKCFQRGVIIAETYRDLFFVHPADVLALMEIMDVPEDDRESILRRVLHFESECNKHRPARPMRN